jgi:hypothetical protein
MTENVKDRWASGDLYEPYVGRWSRLVAREFLGSTPQLGSIGSMLGAELAH